MRIEQSTGSRYRCEKKCGMVPFRCSCSVLLKLEIGNCVLATTCSYISVQSIQSRDEYRVYRVAEYTEYAEYAEYTEYSRVRIQSTLL